MKIVALDDYSPLTPQQRAALEQILSEASEMLDYTERFVPRGEKRG